MISIILIIFLILVFKPFIDRTSNGSIVIWYNWNKKRTYKYLWKV